MTKFKEYLKSQKMSQLRASERFGLSQSFISELANGIKTPSLEIATKIDALTDGRVSFRDWVKIYDPSQTI